MAGTTDTTGRHCGCTCARKAPQLLTVPEVGARLGISRTAVYALVGDGRIGTVRWGGTIRVSEDTLAGFIARATVPGRA